MALYAMWVAGSAAVGNVTTEGYAFAGGGGSYGTKDAPASPWRRHRREHTDAGVRRREADASGQGHHLVQDGCDVSR